MSADSKQHQQAVTTSTVNQTLIIACQNSMDLPVVAAPYITTCDRDSAFVGPYIGYVHVLSKGVINMLKCEYIRIRVTSRGVHCEHYSASSQSSTSVSRASTINH